MKRKWLLLVLSLVLLGVSTTADVPKSIVSADNSAYLVTMVDNFTSWRQNSPRYVDVWVYPWGMVEARELGLAQRETAIGTIVGFGPNDMVKLPYGVLAYYGDGRVIAGNSFIWRTGVYGWAGVGAVKNPSFSEIAGMRVSQFPADPPPPGYPLAYPGQPPQPPAGCYYDEDGNLVCPPPPGYPPPPSQPSATAGWTYQFGQNVGAGWTSISASANELVVITTGPATHREHSFPGGVDRGTIIIFAGAVNDSVYLPFGGWVGRYTSPNPSGAWPSLLDDRISAMRRWDNCSTGYGCRWLDILVIGSGGYSIYGPVLRGPYY